MKQCMEKAINDQINAEIASSYLYLAMAAYCDNTGLPGAANWMRQQVQEELFHVMKMYHYLVERGGKVVLGAIAQPPHTWESPLAVFQAVLDHEKKVTGLINTLTDLAIKESDHATINFLQWFIAEQVEEEAAAGAVVAKLKLAGNDTSALLYLDAELGRRIFTMPAQTA